MIAHRRALASLWLFGLGIVCAATPLPAAAASATTWTLTGTWQGDAGNVMDLQQADTTIKWFAHPSVNPAWAHDFTGALQGADINGHFQDRPGYSLHQSGSIRAHVLDNCHFRIVLVQIDGGPTTSGGETFTKTPCPPAPTPTPAATTASPSPPAATSAAIAFSLGWDGVAFDDKHVDAEISGKGTVTGGPATLPARHKIVEYDAGQGILAVTLKKLGTKTLRVKLRVTSGMLENPDSEERHRGVQDALAIQGSVVETTDPKNCPAGSEATVIAYGKLGSSIPGDLVVDICGRKHTFSSSRSNPSPQIKLTPAGTAGK